MQSLHLWKNCEKKKNFAFFKKIPIYSMAPVK